MFLSGRDPNELVKTMSNEMNHVIDWLKLNKLSLNLSKTHFILFRRKSAKIELNEQLIVDKVKINMVDSTKFLGVHIDQSLTFQKHISYIQGKVSRGIGILFKCKPVLNERLLKTLYNTLIYPYFTYCIEVWGSTYSTYLEPLIKAQKRAVRTVAGARKYEHTFPLYQRLMLLNLKQIYLYFVQLFMYKYQHKKLPIFFDTLFTRNSNIHRHHTRQENELHLPLIISMPCSRTIRISGVHSYNYFGKIFDMNISYEVYKKRLKKHLLNLKDTSIVWNIL